MRARVFLMTYRRPKTTIAENCPSNSCNRAAARLFRHIALRIMQHTPHTVFRGPVLA
jgi:hypothetical protein